MNLEEASRVSPFIVMMSEVKAEKEFFLLISSGLDAPYRWLCTSGSDPITGNCLVGVYVNRLEALGVADRFNYKLFFCNSLLEVGLLIEILKAGKSWEKNQYETIARVLEKVETCVCPNFRV